MRSLLLVAHVVGAILLLGPTTLATSRFARHATNADLPAASDAHRTSRTYFNATIVVPVIGLVLAYRIDAFGDLWVDAAIGVFAAGALLLALVHLPAQRAAIERLQAGDEVGSPTLARLRSSAGIYALSWVAIVWLMVDKPT